MAEAQEELELDQAQVKKAVLALQAFLKSTSSPECLLLNESQHISLLFSLWKIPRQEQTIRIPLPHGIRTETGEVCLFTRDEPSMTSDQTERFYKKLLTERGVKNITEVIPFKVLKTEYKPFEAKRRLLGNFDLFLADARIRRLLPSHIGKHFYERKKSPLSVDLSSKHLARDLERLIQGTTITISKKGSCCMARVAHTGMAADEIVENIVATVNTISSKLFMKGKVMKIIHLKSQTSVALPIYTSDLSHLSLVEEEQLRLSRNNTGKKKTTKKTNSNQAGEADKEEEIPQLVPIEAPSKKAKMEVPSKKGLKKAPRPAGGKGQKNRKGQQGKLAKKSSKAPTQKLRRKVPKSS